MSNIIRYSNNTVEYSINKHSNLLIIGKAANGYSYKTIQYEDDYDSVLKNYGKSDLTDAFKTAYDNGIKDIFLLNIQNNFDINFIIEDLKQNDFTYIVFTNTFFSDFYYDVYNHNKKTYYAELLLREIKDKNNSIFIFTDKHASLYDDQKAFLKDMNTLSNEITKSISYCPNKENLIFVTNNLIDYKMSNIILAVALCTTDISLYPNANFGKAYFLIDQYDTTYNFAYFKNHTEINTTVENLLNFNNIGPSKIVTISRILKFIQRELDFSEFCGRLYNEYQKLLIYKKIETYLRTLVDYVIYRYDIISLTPYKDPQNPCTVIVVCDIDIWPKNCLEKTTISLGVEVG